MALFKFKFSKYSMLQLVFGVRRFIIIFRLFNKPEYIKNYHGC